MIWNKTLILGKTTLGKILGKNFEVKFRLKENNFCQLVIGQSAVKIRMGENTPNLKEIYNKIGFCILLSPLCILKSYKIDIDI